MSHNSEAGCFNAVNVLIVDGAGLLREHFRVHLSLPPVYFIQYLEISYHLHKLLNIEREAVDDYNGKFKRSIINVLFWRE
jgi:hypothetical protein